MNILYLVPQIPNVTKIRSHFQVRGLTEAGHQVTVATLLRGEDDGKHVRRLQEAGVAVISAPLTRLKAGLNSLSVLPTRLPLQSAYAWSGQLMQAIEAHCAQHPPDIVHVEHLRMARYGLRMARRLPTVWDAVDYLTPLYEQASITSASPLWRIIARLEAARLRHYERWLTGQFPVTLVISRRDLAFFQTDNPHASHVKVAPLGLPIHAIDHSPIRSPNTIVMTGTFNYHPNVASALHFVNEIYPLIRQQRPDVRLQLVGANPTPAIRALHSETIEVTGFVPSIVDYLQQATIALAPVLYGSGMNIKVLEAFLNATPLVATSAAVAGLDVSDGDQLLTADEPAAFAGAVLRLLDDAPLRAKIGQAGRRYIEAHHDIVKTTGHLVEMYREVIG
jgi:polysaccharide biosynthesis protein PslH